MASPKKTMFPLGISPTTAATTRTTTPALPICLLPMTGQATQATQAIVPMPTSRHRSVRFADQQPASDLRHATSSTLSGGTGARTLHAQHHPVCENVPSTALMSKDSFISNVSSTRAQLLSPTADFQPTSRVQLPSPMVGIQPRSEPPVQSPIAEGCVPGAAEPSEEIGRSSSPSKLPSPAFSVTATTTTAAAPCSVGPTLFSNRSGGSNNSDRVGNIGTLAGNSHLHSAQRKHDASDRQGVASSDIREAPSPGLPNGNDGAHRQVSKPCMESAESDGPAGLRSPHPTLGNVEAAATTVPPQANKLGTTTLEPCDGATFASGNRVRCESSRAIVPYIGDGEYATLQLPKRQQLYNFIYEGRDNNTPGFDPVVSRLSASHPPSLVSEGGPSTNCQSTVLDLATYSSASDCLGSHTAIPPATATMPHDPEQRPDNWVVLSAAQAEQAAKKLRDQVQKTKELEGTVKKHKRERVLLYDAAMKQAAKREEEGISEAKQTFEREEVVMRETVDKELRKISDLYQDRCQDYAQMVSDECEGEVSKASADLRKDWVRQKKTIDQLVRGGGEEDRRVEVIARAVTEQLQEERKDELAAIRAEICSDVKLEFESREEDLRDALESEFQADLDGQLLLAEIRHQKEIDLLRAELSVRETPCTEAASGTMVVYTGDTPKEGGKGEGSSNAPPPSSPSPSLSRRPLQPKNRVGFAAEGKSVAASTSREAATANKKPRLGTKLPAFKPPLRAVSRNDHDKTAAKMPSKLSGGTAPPKTKVQTKVPPKSKVQPTASPKVKVQTKKPRTASLGRRAKDTKKPAIAKETLDDVEPSTHDKDLDEGITSALTVSPVKGSSGDIFTPSTDNEGDPSEQPSRLKKRAKKRLFSAST